MSEQPERIEFSNRVEYRLNGKLHRLDGPAVEKADGGKLWYIMGRKVSKIDVDSFRLKRLTLSFVVNRRIWKLFGTNNAKKVI